MKMRPLVSLGLLFCMTLLTPASAEAPSAAPTKACPTKLDLVVLASLADASGMMVMSNLRVAAVSAGERARVVGEDPHQQSGAGVTKTGE